MAELSVKIRTPPHGERAEPTAESSPDLRLMRRIAARDEAAFRELISLHGDMLARLVGRLLAWHADCDDVLQDVLVVTWRKAGTYQGGGSLEGWLRRLAINRCRNHFRMLSRVRSRLDGFAQYLSGQKRESMEVFGPARDGLEETRIGVALSKLKPDDRTAIVMYYLEGYTVSEVARELNVRPDTLHVRLHRIRKQLRTILES